MNIDSIKIYPANVTQAKAKHKENRNVLEYGREIMGESANKNEKLNRGYQSGSLTSVKNNEAVTFGSAAKAAAAVANGTEKAAKDTVLDKMFKLCDKHTVIAQNLVALLLAAGPRPLAIMLMPGVKDREDRVYASGHAIASAVIGFGFSSLVMYPLGQAAAKAKDILRAAGKADTNKLSEKTIQNVKKMFNVKNLEELEHSKAFKNITKIADMAPDVFIFGIAKAILTVKLIKPIMKYVFGLEKKDQSKQQEQPAVQKAFAGMASVIKPEIQKFAGGLK